MSNSGDVRPKAGHIPREDWDLLFDAVAWRLRRHARDAAVGEPVRGVIEDCVQSLQMLHSALDVDQDHLRRLDLQLRQASAALASARLELAAARAAEPRTRPHRDGQTELPDRSEFLRRLGDALGGGQTRPATLAVLFMDLQVVEPTDDQRGQDIDDDMLRIVAQRLRRAMHAEDLLCRLGGNQLACLVARSSEQVPLARLAGQLVDAVSTPLQSGAREMSLRPSIGIAVYPIDGDAIATLLERADAAVNRAKAAGLSHAFCARPADQAVGAAGSAPENLSAATASAWPGTASRART